MNVRIEGFRAPQKLNLSFLEISGYGDSSPIRTNSRPFRALIFFSTIFHDLPKLRFLAMHAGSCPEDPCMEYLPTLTPKVI